MTQSFTSWPPITVFAHHYPALVDTCTGLPAVQSTSHGSRRITSRQFSYGLRFTVAHASRRHPSVLKGRTPMARDP